MTGKRTPTAGSTATQRPRADDLVAVVYDELRGLARRYLAAETKRHTLQPTALVHEAYLKLSEQDRADWNDKSHFFAVAAQAMRRILVDHARGRKAKKRGGPRRAASLDESLVVSMDRAESILEINDLIERLETLDRRQAQLLEMRVFGGMTVEEAAAALEISKRTAEREWTMVRSWLRRELSGTSGPTTT